MANDYTTDTRVDWDVLQPHVIPVDVGPEHIDHMGHVNNAAYLVFMEDTAWSHTNSLGLTWADYQTMDAGFVVRHHELDYLAAAMEGDHLLSATWISSNDQRLTIWRGYQICRPADGKTLLRGRSKFICVRPSNGKPRRMPQAFIDAYVPRRDG